MAKAPAQPRPANLSLDQMRAALPKLDRRLKELAEFPVDRIEKRSDPRIRAMETDIDGALAEIFGADTLEYQQHRGIRYIDKAGHNLMYETPMSEVRDGLDRGCKSAAAVLGAIRKRFVENLEDAGMTAGSRAISAYSGLDLHKEVSRACSKLYLDGHYAGAVEAAVKAVNGLVRFRSGLELDGSTLMERAFAPSNPILKFNALADQSDRDEQRGFMMMFSGAVAGLRNPRAHGFIKDDPERALEYIAFVSLLAKLLDEAEGP